MNRRMPKISTSRCAAAFSAATLAVLLSACAPSSPSAAARPAAAQPATFADPNADLPEIVITASRSHSTPATPEPKSARARSRSRDPSS